MMITVSRAGMGLAAITGFTVLMSSATPGRSELSDTIIINAPKEIVWEQISKLSNQSTWAALTTLDPRTNILIEGNDGKSGATMLWNGRDTDTEGMQRTTALKKEKQYQGKMKLTRPQKTEADVNITMRRLQGGQVEVSYIIGYKPSTSQKAMAMFMADSKLERHIVSSLKKLKSRCERLSNIKSRYGVQIVEREIPQSVFAGKRGIVKLDNLVKAQRIVGQKVANMLGQEGRDVPYTASLYYSWDERTNKADLAAVAPVLVPVSHPDAGYENFYLSARKYVVAECRGGLNKIDATHRAINAYLRDKGKKFSYPIIEEHIVGPAHQQSPDKWHTRIMYAID